MIFLSVMMKRATWFRAWENAAAVYQTLSIIATARKHGHSEEWVDKPPFRGERAQHQPAAASLTLRKVQGNEEHFVIADRQSSDSGQS